MTISNSTRSKLEANPGPKWLDRIRNHPVLSAVLLILLLEAAFYWPSLRSPVFLQGEESILNVSLVSRYQNIPRIFSQDFLLFTSGQYRPVGYALLAVVRTFVASDNFVFWHLWLLGFHAVNALLVFVLVRHFTPRLSTPFLAAAAFCLHPLCTMPVNNINQFHLVLGSALFLGALNAYLRFARGKAAPFYILALVLYLIALFTASQALAVGIVLFSYERFWSRTAFKTLLLRLLPFAALPLLFYRFLFMASPHPLHFKYVQMYDGSFWDGFFSVTGTTGLVIQGLLLAYPLPSLLHEVATQIFDWNNPHFLVWVSFNAVVCGVSIWALRRKTWAALGLLVMYISMLPYATVYFNRVTEYVSFNYYYFPVVGLAFFVGGSFEWLHRKNQRFWKSKGAVCLLVLLLVWGGRTLQLNWTARTPVAYWNAVLTNAQKTGQASPVASTRLGKALLEQKDVPHALQSLFSPENESLNDSCLVMAEYYLEQKEYLASAIHLHRCLEQEATGIVYQSKSEVAAELYTAAGALDYAEDNLGVILMVNPFNTRMMAVLSRVWLWKGYVQEARRMLDRIRDCNPTDPNAIRCQQEIDAYEKDVRAGIPVVSPPSPSSDWLDFAFQHQRSPRIRQEIIALSRRVDSHDPIVQLEAMLSLMEEENYAEAVTKANAVYSSLQNNSYACAVICELLAKTSNVDTAIQVGKRAVQLDKNNKLAWRNLGIAYAQKESFSEKDNAFLKQFDQNTSFSSMFYLNLGIQKRKKGEYTEAIALLEKALEANPQNADIYLILAESLTLGKQPERAIEIIKQALAIKKDDPNLYANLGISLFSLRRWDEGDRAFQTAIKLNPNNHYYHYNYAMGLMNQNKIAEAVVEYQRTVDLKPDFLQAVSQLGYCMQRAGRLDEAAAQYKIIIQSDPAYEYAHYNLGSLYMLQGKFEQAVAEYEEEIARHPNLVAPYDTLAKAYCESGHFDRAKAVLDRASARQVRLNEAVVKQVQAGLQP